MFGLGYLSLLVLVGLFMPNFFELVLANGVMEFGWLASQLGDQVVLLFGFL